MAESRMQLMTAKEAARYLRVSMFTLSKIEREGGLAPYRTPGGHRRYSLPMLNEYLDRSRGLIPLLTVQLDPKGTAPTLRIDPQSLASLLMRILEREIRNDREFLSRCGIIIRVHE